MQLRNQARAQQATPPIPELTREVQPNERIEDTLGNPPVILRQEIECDPLQLQDFEPGKRTLRTTLRIAQAMQIIHGTEREALERVVNDVANWICHKDGAPTTHYPLGLGRYVHCPHRIGEGPTMGKMRFVVRAKRVNVYPDSVELVFWDVDERPMSSAFVVFVALEALKSLEKFAEQGLIPNFDFPDLPELCDSPRIESAGLESHPYFRADFVRRSWNFDTD